jgi:hypothetical protein
MWDPTGRSAWVTPAGHGRPAGGQEARVCSL